MMPIHSIHLLAAAVSIAVGGWLILKMMRGLRAATPASNDKLNLRETFFMCLFLIVFLLFWSAGIVIAASFGLLALKANPGILSIVAVLFFGTWVTVALWGWCHAVVQLVTALRGRSNQKVNVSWRVR